MTPCRTLNVDLPQSRYPLPPAYIPSIYIASI